MTRFYHSLRFKVLIGAGFFAVTALIPTLTTLYFVNAQASDAKVIDIAGRQRMLAYRMAVEARELILELDRQSFVSEATREKLSDTMALFEGSLNALTDGGPISGTDGIEVHLPSTTGKSQAQLQEVRKKWADYKSQIQIVTDPKANVMGDDFFGATLAVEKDGPVLLDAFNEAAVVLKDTSEGKTAVLKAVQIASCGLTTLIALLFWFLANNAVVKPIHQTSAIMDLVAEKNLTQSLSFKRNDEIGSLGLAVNRMITNMGALLGQIVESATVIAGASEELSVSANQIAQGSELQSRKTLQVAGASQQASTTLVDVAQNLASVVQVAEETSRLASKGGQAVKKSIEGSCGLSNTSKETGRAIKRLENRSQEIGEVIKVINDIADQTNLLALNAAIEAARAGDQGRGFSVVADEVRKLAEKTTRATQEIEETVKAIQTEAGSTLATVENEAKAVEEGVALATETGSDLDAIIEHVEKVTSMISQISAASEEQASTITQISVDIDSVACITQQNSSGSQNIAKTSQEIAKLAAALNASGDLFQLDDPKKA